MVKSDNHSIRSPVHHSNLSPFKPITRSPLKLVTIQTQSPDLHSKRLPDHHSNLITIQTLSPDHHSNRLPIHIILLLPKLRKYLLVFFFIGILRRMIKSCAGNFFRQKFLWNKMMFGIVRILISFSVI